MDELFGDWKFWLAWVLLAAVGYGVFRLIDWLQRM